MRITRTGRYLTKDNRVAIITRITNERSYGKMPGNYDRTWWYTSTGEHAVCLVDDLVKFAGKVAED